MKVAVLQSAYIPWRGFFDIISSVDVFVLYDDVQYSKGSWRNRNKLLFGEDTRWITLPVRVSLGELINQVVVSDNQWRERHSTQITTSLGGYPFFAEAYRLWQTSAASNTNNLSEINEKLIRGICAYLGITSRIVRSEAYPSCGTKTDRLLELLGQLGATHYLSGPSASNYLEVEKFIQAGIKVTYKTYDYASYPQPGRRFVGEVSVLDLIASLGQEARNHITSRTPEANP